MSYIIKGFEFPQSCSECWLIYPEGGGTGECIFTNKYWDSEKAIPSKSRLPECPLVEIPTPHGRLIDADRLMEVIEKNSYLLKGYYNSLENGMFLTGIKQAIDEAPTIIEAEVSE